MRLNPIGSVVGRPLAALLLLAFLILSPALAGVVRAQELAVRPDVWLVVETAGDAEVRHERGPWQPLAAGAAVAAASEIRTGRAALVVLTRGRDRVRLMADSYLELPAPAGENDVMTRLVQWLGSAFFEVDHRPAPQFEVDTPFLTAIVKGTAFAIDVSRDEAAIAVTEGVVRAATPDGAATDVAAGHTARGYRDLTGLTIEETIDGTIAAPDGAHDWPSPSFPTF